jgi:ATP-binding cassette subfamily B protein
MIVKYYGKYYSLDTLKKKCEYTRIGVSMLGISQAAESIGLRSTGVRVSFEELCSANLPCIVHWNQKHFVVLYGIKGKEGNRQMLVADPAGGLHKYTEKEFKKCWISTVNEGTESGTALLLEPTPEFYREEGEESARKGFGFLFSYIKPYKQLFTQLIIGLLAGSIIQLILPLLTQNIVDIGIGNQDIGFIWVVLIAQLVLTLSSVFVDFIRGWILLHIGVRINISLISDFLAKLMRLPIGFFDTKMTGDIMQRIGDNRRIQQLLTSSSLNILFSMVNILIFGIVLLIYSSVIFLIFFTASALYILWITLFLKKRRELDFKAFSQNAANQSSIVQLITGMQEIKLNACEKQKRWEWEDIQAKLFKISIKGLALGQYQEAGATLINQIKNIIITVVAAGSVINGELTLGMMMSVQYIIGQLNSPVAQIIGFIRQTQDAKISLERLAEIHEKEDEINPEKGLISDIPEQSDIVIKDLSFKYEGAGNENVLNDITFRIPFGRVTAIVGSSGSGKTTLIKLMLGFYPVKKGSIEIGQNNLQNYNIEEWRKRCGVVMQEGFIFSDTIANNIAPGAEIIDKKALADAVKTANIDEFIEFLPLSYNSKIGQEGHGISQGQKQRLLIARAVYKNPDYIFFDEATNSLDANNEKTIMENLAGFFRGRTVLVVAHRLSTVKHADNIIVLEKGRIAEQGTHQQLIANRAQYYELIRNQLELEK